MHVIVSALLLLMALPAEAQDVFAAPADNSTGAEAPADGTAGMIVPMDEKSANANNDAIFMLPPSETTGRAGNSITADALSQEAYKGSVSAAASLGRMYLIGAFGEPDIAKAQYWLRIADQRGDAHSPFLLAQIFENGTPPMPKSMRDAMPLYQRSADRGDPEAQYRIYRAYRDGDGGYAKDMKKARYWLGVAAKTGRSPQVMLELADLVDAGRDGVVRDPEFAQQLREEVRKMSSAQ